MSTTRTPLRYPGGKSAYAALLDQVIHLNNLKDVVLVEPYAGGAGASIKLLLEGKVKGLILNDLDPAVYAFWWSLVHHSQWMISRIEKCKVTIDEWKRQREIYRRKNENDLRSLGFATLFLNRCNRSGILTANPIGGINQQGDYKVDARFTKAGLIKKIADIAAMASMIDVRNSSCEKLIRGFNRRKNVSNLLVYLDPPYFRKGPSLYLNHYSIEDHTRLSNLIKHSKFNWIMSYDYCDEILGLYADIPTYKSDLRYTIIGNQEASEIIATRLIVPPSLKCLNKEMMP